MSDAWLCFCCKAIAFKNCVKKKLKALPVRRSARRSYASSCGWYFIRPAHWGRFLLIQTAPRSPDGIARHLESQGVGDVLVIRSPELLDVPLPGKF